VLFTDKFYPSTQYKEDNWGNAFSIDIAQMYSDLSGGKE